MDRKAKRKYLIHRDGNKCCYCKRKFPENELTLEHIIPQKRKWPNIHRVENLKLSCIKCNRNADETDKLFAMDYRIAQLRGFFNPDAVDIVVSKGRCFYHEQIKEVDKQSLTTGY